MEEGNKNTTLVKRENTDVARISKSLAITNKLLALNDDPFLIPYRKRDKWGYCDKNKKIVIPCIYDDNGIFSEGLASIMIKDKYGFIDKTGKEIIPCIYDGARSFSEGLAVVEINWEYGFIDKTGKVIIPFNYRNASSFLEGLALVQNNKKYGFINKLGQEVTPCKYWSEDDFYDEFSFYTRRYFFKEGLALLQIKDKHGFIDKTGKEVIPFIFDHAYSFSEGLAVVKYNDKWGFIDKTGKEVIPFTFDHASSFSEGLASVKNNKKYGFIDKTGKEIITCNYDNAFPFCEKLARVWMSNEGEGFIDRMGREIIPIQDFWGESKGFSEGLACALNYENQKWGYIDKTGKEIIPYIYHAASSFSKGLAVIETDSGCGCIDKTGKEIIPSIYDQFEFYNVFNFHKGLARVRYKGKWSYIDKAGTQYWEDLTDILNQIKNTLETINDIDGNIYHVVKIGTQVWMIENLNVSHFRNGDIISEAKTYDEWIDKQPVWCNHNSHPKNDEIWGKLYDWNTIKDLRGLAPQGWHVPSDTEWNTLQNFLGSEAGSKMKEADLISWQNPDTGFENINGSITLPSGSHSHTHVGYASFIWSSNGSVWYMHNNNIALSDFNKSQGFSVRCLKDY